jgi:putative membrane protein
MFVQWFLAATHLLAFALALSAVLARGKALRSVSDIDPSTVRGVLIADNIWGISALVLLVTGGLRAFGGYEKGSDYYLHQPLFHVKMTLLVLILLLELAPMIRFIKWRIGLVRGTRLDLHQAGLFARISHLQALLVVLMMIAATGMARGVGLG